MKILSVRGGIGPDRQRFKLGDTRTADFARTGNTTRTDAPQYTLRGFFLAMRYANA